MFTISTSNRTILQDNTPFFYLADTCWSAFTNISEEDWEYYLDYRKAQGFNVIQVNMLRQWDSSQSTLNISPFSINENGQFNFSEYQDDYFKRAYRMFEKASEKGLTIALVLLWANYVPNTWASQMPLRQLGIMPEEMVESYVDKVMELYDKFHPIYIISGDTDFQTDLVIDGYYSKALNRIKKNNPNCIATLHIRGREDDIPKKLKENKNLDFYMYQSGHNPAFPDCQYTLAKSFYQMRPKRPLLNSEPCYEMMGFARKAYGRFSREDVRKVAWQSVLSGASGGLTYGAHGIWSWHNSQLIFDSSIGEAFETPFDWHDALHFKGAWDYAYLKEFIVGNNLFDLTPCQEILLNQTEEIRVATSGDKIIVYIPSAILIKLRGDFSDYKTYYIDLEGHQTLQARVTYIDESGESHVQMHRFTRDALLVIEK